ncbi:MAG: hypothetical protein D6781_01540 [Verrucomicrobia bacterium]|nr:MAG: hypothetical protein D6781_01540 [Verrucomicrobiota bacterium]
MSFQPSPHPVLLLPTPEQMAAMGKEELREFLVKREELIRLEKEDPLTFGYAPWTFDLANACLAQTAEEAEALLESADRKARQMERRNPLLRGVADSIGFRGRGADVFGHTDVLVMGQNRCGKTIWAVRRVLRRIVEQPKQMAAIFEASEQASINKQQSLVHEHLPPEWRDIGKAGQVAYVKWTKQNGFAGGKFTLPNESQGLFFNYKQDVGVFEGYELDVVWFDELVPLAFLEAMEFRLGQDRRMEMLTTFTPVAGYTPTVARYLDGARLVLTHRAVLLPEDAVHAPGCPPGHMPLLMQCRQPQSCVVWFPWGSNPFGANEEVRGRLEGAALAKIKLRAYGWTEKLVGGAFPLYGAPHRLSRDEFAEICERGVTRYMAVDPGGTKNWFIKWYAVTPQGWVIVYREWPDWRTYGEWALPPGGYDRVRLHDYRPGPAQRTGSGRGIRGYKELILTLEGWRWDAEAKRWDGSAAERIEARVMDPRMGGAPAPKEDEGTSIIALMGELQPAENGLVEGPPMFFEKAPASRVEETIQMINSYMEYNPEEPITALNCPRWYVVAEDCQHSDLAYQVYTGAGTERDALKDVIDPDRYFVKSDFGWVGDGDLDARVPEVRAG